MGEIAVVKEVRGLARAAVMVSLTGLAAACTAPAPAPVEMRGYEAMSAPPSMAIQAPHRIIVKRDQTVRSIAHEYRVTVHELVVANHLKPPYDLKPGMRLVIPDHLMAMATPPSSLRPVPLPPPTPQTIGMPPAASRTMPEVVPLDGPAPAAAAKPGSPPSVVAPRNAAAALPRPGEEAAVPLSAPPRAAAAPPPAMVPASAPPGQSAAESAAALGSGRFPWPVHGRILSAYGNGPDGAHNDGINIGAARGAPVRSIDAGTVAYVGNEVHGYGNLVLVKHANGWISAYAHLDGVAVKVGDQVGGGQEIGQVGNTGGVIEPQLHFELRRGKKPVDPRAFLVTAPSAANPAAPKG
jgi:murein DD-endopeptidase MepM/ murein hydrolase activator NlpD